MGRRDNMALSSSDESSSDESDSDDDVPKGGMP